MGVMIAESGLTRVVAAQFPSARLCLLHPPQKVGG